VGNRQCQLASVVEGAIIQIGERCGDGGLTAKEAEALHGAPEKVSGSAIWLTDAAHSGSSEARRSDVVTLRFREMKSKLPYVC
jgi:hypothetical protein